MNDAEATAPEAVVEGTPEVSTPAAEIAPSVDVNSGTQTNDSDGDSFDAGVKIDELPENVRSYATNVEKQFKGAYTRKTQELAEQRKLIEAERAQAKEAVEQYQKMLRDVLSDEEKAKAYRKIYGQQEAPAKPQQPQLNQFNTVEEWQTAMSKYVADETQRARAEAAQIARQEATQVYSQQREQSAWQQAISESTKDPVFEKYGSFILDHIRSNPEKYRGDYVQKGPAGVISTVTQQFKSLYAADLEAAKKEGLGRVEEKKKASAFVPGKVPQTTSAPGKAKTTAELIAELKRERPDIF